MNCTYLPNGPHAGKSQTYVLDAELCPPLTIQSTLPSAGLRALRQLMLFGFDFSLMSLIAIVLLIGIVKKNGIMLVDFAIAAERSRGLPPAAAIREACLLRLRPILMTTMAALLGGVPLMLGAGTRTDVVEDDPSQLVVDVGYLYRDRIKDQPRDNPADALIGCVGYGERQFVLARNDDTLTVQEMTGPRRN